jgi:NTP pyrophosphatase (non-canonical NTP hydrolase)
MTTIKELTIKVNEVIDDYRERYPEVKLEGKDYLPFKISEEWGECIKAFLMATDRGRQKGLTKEEISKNLSDEMADVFAYILAFAQQENIDLEKALEAKWFQYLKQK